MKFTNFKIFQKVIKGIQRKYNTYTYKKAVKSFQSNFLKSDQMTKYKIFFF